MTELTNIGLYLHKLRIKNNFTRKEISESTGISIDAIRRIEKGYVIIKLETLQILSNFYGMPIINIIIDEKTVDI